MSHPYQDQQAAQDGQILLTYRARHRSVEDPVDAGLGEVEEDAMGSPTGCSEADAYPAADEHLGHLVRCPAGAGRGRYR